MYIHGYPKGRTMNARLVKWGNSQGIRIPKDVCEMLDITVGSMGHMEIDYDSSSITITFEKNYDPPRYTRRSHATLEELAAQAGWDGSKVGSEWGGDDVGSEEVA